LCQELLKACPDITYSISYTTRAPRGAEQDGTDYHFITREAFQARIDQGLMAEWAEVHGNYYGTSLEALEASVAQGIDVLLDIDVQGARQMCDALPECVTIFIMPPSVEELRARLEKRGTDSPEIIETRMKNAAGEMDQRGFYHHVIVNDNLGEAVAACVAVVTGCREGVSL